MGPIMSTLAAEESCFENGDEYEIFDTPTVSYRAMCVEMFVAALLNMYYSRVVLSRDEDNFCIMLKTSRT